jgi:hypothetical protein
MARMRIPVMNGVGLSTVTYFIPLVNGIVDIAVTAVRGVESKEHVADRTDLATKMTLENTATVDKTKAAFLLTREVCVSIGSKIVAICTHRR